MGCNCQFNANLDDSIYALILNDGVVRAKELVYCDECRECIPVGRAYHFEEIMLEEDKRTHSTCLDCREIRDKLFCDYIYGQLMETLWDRLWQNGGSINEDCLSALTKNTRARVCSIIEHIWAQEDERGNLY